MATDDNKLIIEALIKLLSKNEDGSDRFEGPFFFGVHSENVKVGKDDQVLDLEKVLGDIVSAVKANGDIATQLNDLRNFNIEQNFPGDLKVLGDLYTNGKKVITDIVSISSKGYAPRIDLEATERLTSDHYMLVAVPDTEKKSAEPQWRRFPESWTHPATDYDDGLFSSEYKKKFDKMGKQIDDILYVPPQIVLFKLLGVDNDDNADLSPVDLTSDNLTRNFGGFQHQESSTELIEGTLTFSYEGGSKNIDKSSNITSIREPFEVTFTQGDTSSKVISLSGLDGKNNALYAEIVLETYYPPYIGASSEEEVADLTAFTRAGVSSKFNEITSMQIEPDAAQYIYFCAVSPISSICAFDIEVPIVKLDNINYKGGSYYVYRTEHQINPGTYNFIIE